MGHSAETRAAYLQPVPLLRNRLMFTISVHGEAPHAASAVFKINSPAGVEGDIASLVSQGFLVRTRADTQDLSEKIDKGRAFSARDSQAQIVSFDWFVTRKWYRWFSRGLLDCVSPSIVNMTSSLYPFPGEVGYDGPVTAPLVELPFCNATGVWEPFDRVFVVPPDRDDPDDDLFGS